MKRLISALMMVCLLLGGLSAGAEETYTLSAKEYDFDFTLKLFPEAFPEKLREKARGYADFLGALRWKGSFLKATAGRRGRAGHQLHPQPGHPQRGGL